MNFCLWFCLFLHITENSRRHLYSSAYVCLYVLHPALNQTNVHAVSILVNSIAMIPESSFGKRAEFLVNGAIVTSAISLYVKLLLPNVLEGLTLKAMAVFFSDSSASRAAFFKDVPITSLRKSGASSGYIVTSSRSIEAGKSGSKFRFIFEIILVSKQS